MAGDTFDLQRFVDAQEGGYDGVVAELRAVRKRSHWIWYVFPQVDGLGRSSMSKKFAISGREEAIAYLAHPILGPRLRECAALVHAVEGRAIGAIMGWPDDLKFRSSMTLFAEVTADNEIFLQALQKYFGGEKDSLTMDKLRGRG